DLVIQAIPNAFSVYGDPNSTAADSADWNSAFVTEWMPKKLFEKRYPDAEEVDWESGAYTKLNNLWVTKDEILLAEWWQREEVAREILLLSDGHVVGEDDYEAGKDLFDLLGVAGKTSGTVKSFKGTHRMRTGAEILEETSWAGRYIPIIPVYGEEVNLEGKRIFRSLIRDAKDPQRMFNYWRTAATELVALAPKAPFIGPERAFNGEDAK